MPNIRNAVARVVRALAPAPSRGRQGSEPTGLGRAEFEVTLAMYEQTLDLYRQTLGRWNEQDWWAGLPDGAYEFVACCAGQVTRAVDVADLATATRVATDALTVLFRHESTMTHGR